MNGTNILDRILRAPVDHDPELRPAVVGDYALQCVRGGYRLGIITSIDAAGRATGIKYGTRWWNWTHRKLDPIRLVVSAKHCEPTAASLIGARFKDHVAARHAFYPHLTPIAKAMVMCGKGLRPAEPKTVEAASSRRAGGEG